MKTKITYEWTLETIEDGDIVDSCFEENLSSFDKSDLEVKDLGLVRNEGNEHEGITDRFWAYVKDGKLPERFQDGTGGEIDIKVPQKFHKELAKYLAHT